MSDELLAAAIHVEEFAGQVLELVPEDAKVPSLKAALMLADAYLAEHPADDAEPITEEWLRSVGFVQRGQFALAIEKQSSEKEVRDSCRFVISCADYLNLPCCWELWNEFHDNTESEGSCLPCQPATRGEARRLCAALGIPLKPI